MRAFYGAPGLFRIEWLKKWRAFGVYDARTRQNIVLPRLFVLTLGVP